VEKQIGLEFIKPERQRVRNEMDLMSTRCQLLAQFGGYDSGSPATG